MKSHRIFDADLKAVYSILQMQRAFLFTAFSQFCNEKGTNRGYSQIVKRIFVHLFFPNVLTGFQRNGKMKPVKFNVEINKKSELDQQFTERM